MGVALRPAMVVDFEFLFTLHAASLGPYVDEIWGWDDDEQRAYLRRNLDLDCAQIIVVDGVDVGRLDVLERDDEIYLALIEVAPDHQGQGLGTRLIRDVVRRAVADAKRVALDVLEVNDRAFHLYQRLGFVEVSRERAAPEVRIRMVAQP